MRAFLVLSDTARAHSDGTFSLLRGGIGNVQTPSNQAIQFRGSVVARITGNMSEAGSHEFMIRILNEDGQPVAPDMGGTFNVPEGGGAGNVVADFGLILPQPGRYTFALSVDRHEIDTWEIRAEEAPPQSSAG